MSTQRKVLVQTCPQPRRTPLLPTPPAAAQQHVKRTLIPRPPPHSNNRYQYKNYLPRPMSINNYNQCPPLQILVITRLYPHLQGQFTLQVSVDLPVLIITFTDQFINLLASQAANQTQFTQQLWSTHTD